MNLRQWHLRNIAYPIFRLLSVLMVVLAILNWYHFNREIDRKNEALSDIIGLAELGFNQKNRDLVEASLNLAVTNLAATQVLMCEEEQLLLSFPQSLDHCALESSDWNQLVLSKVAKSNKDLRFFFQFSRSAQWIYFGFVLALVFVIVLIFLFVLRHLRKTFEQDILIPLAAPSPTPSRISEIDAILTKNQQLEKYKFQEALIKVAHQVAHDIRSPLTGLNMIISQVPEITEDKRVLLRAVSNRINDIANQLLQKSQPLTPNSQPPISDTPKEVSAELLPALVDMLMTEKRAQYQHHSNLQLEADLEESYGAFARIKPTEFTRVLSNLVDNAVEALPSRSGRVIVRVKNFNHRTRVTVWDNGTGFPMELLPRLGEPGVTLGKSGNNSGFGLGLSHAKTTIESFGGHFKIDTRQGVGTEIIMDFPLCEPPSWFLDRLQIAPPQTLVALDDDRNILNIWRQKFKALESDDIKLLLFNNETELREWLNGSTLNGQNFLFLIDYELLGSHKTGIDIIRELDIVDRSYLVTSRFEETQVRSQCESLQLKILPKAMAIHLPVEVTR